MRSHAVDPGDDHFRHVRKTLQEFIAHEVIPAESAAAPAPVGHPGIEDLQQRAREYDLWNVLTDPRAGLSWRQQSELAEMTGWSIDLAPRAINAGPPDSVNMAMLHAVADEWQRRLFLAPLMTGSVRSAFAMTEPDVASSDANNISTTMVVDGDEIVITGRKWYISGLLDPRCHWLFVVGLTDPGAPRHRQHSVVAVPIGAPGVRIVRRLPVFGYAGDQGELALDDVRVPLNHLLGKRGDGFQVSQTRLAAARLHHSCRMVGLAERALRMAIDRARRRHVSGAALGSHPVVVSQVAECRLAVTQARLLNLAAAEACDDDGARAAQSILSAAKIAATRMAVFVLDRCLSIHGAAGLSADTPLARWWAEAKSLHIADGPEETHLAVVGRSEIHEHVLAPAYTEVFSAANC
ncbi:acyl-CoA dehydrogenase family protein [Tomitella cavernea]|uniref:Acyl-CoA dehydrogenase family protein n=1 Tax=Tomitella cavernea TaxID=1387982 RepID=A0ABP9C2Y0_9ACTN